MPRERPDTREKLIRSATYLCARRGLDVTLAEIQEHAGQRNVSAVQYHFGGRDELLIAAIERHASTAAEMAEVRADLKARQHDPRSFVEAIVTRLCRMLETPEQRDFLRFSFHLMMRAPHRRRLVDAVDDPHLSSMQAEIELLHGVLPNLPDAVVRERAVAGLSFIIMQVAERARLMDDVEEEPMLDERAFITNLVDMATGLLTSAAQASGRSGRRRRAMATTSSNGKDATTRR